ncbi:MAG: hypothetical protein PHD11_07725 [Bacteroidales bacterium]|nr:hypothetical protein [Bacteroidales bacterium]MDD4669470.1 hypothetical protein [Bacteroidales bacterium]
MTKKSKVYVVASLLIAIASFTSCITTDNTLGSIYVPSNQDIAIKTAEFDLPVTLMSADSLQTAIASTITIGTVASETFGTLRISSAASLSPGDSIDFGTNPVFKEMYMQVYVSSRQTFSSDQKYIPQNVYVYPLNIELDSTHVYNNSISEKDYIHTPISSGNTIYMGGDSIKVIFTKEYGEKLFTATRSELDSSNLFMKRFYGMYLKVDDLQEGMTGGRINNLDLTTAYAILSFTSTNAAGERRDTSVSFQLGKYYVVNKVETGSKHLETDTPDNTVYVEGLSGIKPHIDAKVLKTTIDKWAAQNGIDLNNVLIAKATMEFPFEYSGQYTDYDTYPTNLFPCQRIEDSVYTMYSPISEIYDTKLNNGAINRSAFCYRPDAGLYIQNLIKKDTDKITRWDDIWMMPTITYTNSQTSETYYYSDYLNYYFGTLNGTKSERHPKLRITYTVLK